HGLPNRSGLIACDNDTTSDPDRIMTRTPGHHAANPAKNPQNEPRALWVQTYSEPSSGNMRPSWAVTKPPGIRNVRNPRPQKTNAAGPANCTVDAFGMNRTRATKMTTDRRSSAPCRPEWEPLSRRSSPARRSWLGHWSHLPWNTSHEHPRAVCSIRPGPPSHGIDARFNGGAPALTRAPCYRGSLPSIPAARPNWVAGQERGRARDLSCANAMPPRTPPQSRAATTAYRASV